MTIARKALTPRKQPRQQRAAATVAAILEATAHILEARGIDRLTTNAIAERAGVSIGSLYQYFPGKQVVLAELIRREREILSCQIEAAVSACAGGTLAEAIAAVIAAAVAHQLSRPRLARALDYLEPTLPLAEETAALNAGIVDAVALLLTTHGVQRPAEVARDCVALAKGMIDAAGLAGEADRESLQVRVSRAVMGYLAGG